MAEKSRIILDPNVEPWEKQPSETNNAFQYFITYRDLGPAQRTHTNVAKLHKIRGKSVARFSTDNRWVERSGLYDAWVDRRNTEKRMKTIEEMTVRHIEFGEAMQAVGGHALKELLDRIQAGGNVRLSVTDSLRLIDSGIKLERINMGGPETVAEIKVTGGNPQAGESLSWVDVVNMAHDVAGESSHGDDDIYGDDSEEEPIDAGTS